MSVELNVGGDSSGLENSVSFETREAMIKGDIEVETEIQKEQDRQDRRSPFKDFYQINELYSDTLSNMALDQPKALAILHFIFKHMDKYNALIASYNVFQEQFGISRATVARCIKYLKDHGYIYVYKSGTSNVYVANCDLVWKSWGKNRKYCQFPANVILSDSEQDKRDTKIRIKHENTRTITVKHKTSED